MKILRFVPPKKTIALLYFLLFSFFRAKGQIKEIEEIEQQQKSKIAERKGIFLLLKSVYQSYQDSKFTNLIYSGIGAGFELGYHNEKRHRFWGMGLYFTGAMEKSSVGVPYDAYRFGVSFNYLRNVYQSKNKSLYLGGSWNILDIYFRKAEKLNGKRHLRNNDGAYIAGSTLAFQSIFVYQYNALWQLRTALDFQLFGMMKQSPSFANSPPQDVLEAGDYDFQPSENPLFQNESPLGFLTYHFEPFYKYIRIKFAYEVLYKKHWSFLYHWTLRRSNKVKNYPLTQGAHTIGVKYQF